MGSNILMQGSIVLLTAMLGAVALVVLLIILLVKSRVARMVFGILFTTGGALSAIFGILRANTWQSKILRGFGGSDDVIITCLVAGGISVILGIILLATSGSPAQHNNINVYEKPITAEPIKQVVKIRCISCQSLNDESAKFCENCGTPLSNTKVEAT